MKNKRMEIGIFSFSLLIIIALFVSAIIKTNIFNSKEHIIESSGSDLFKTENKESEGVLVNAAKRTETWGKIIDLNNEGITENNYFSYTYDFNIKNYTNVEIKKFSFKLTFDVDFYLTSAWNGSVEIHQHVNGNEKVALIKDLRDYNPSDYDLDMYFIEGKPFINIYAGDYIIYYPSDSMNALEMPIKPEEGTTPGFIILIENGKSIENSSIQLSFNYYRLFVSDPLFWISISLFLIWAIALIIIIITTLQIRKYNIRHERDNEIINESIETFTGFIDAKDKYTNGHSKRVAIYTRLIAKEMGYEGEELDRIYYIALLHDCGKIGVPDNILGKPGRLTDDEFKIIKSHTTRGGEILSSFKSLENAGEGALYHHERYDGKGYPKGLKGEEIPLIARMICVADSFDAMNSSRVYRKNLSKEYIINELINNKGTQFDPKIADIMLNLIKEGKIKIEDNVDIENTK